MRILLTVIIILNACCAHAQARRGLDRALLFAVNDYGSMTQLYSPIQNAQDIANELEQNYGFIVEVVSNPSFTTIEDKIARYKQRYASGEYEQNGQLFLFFSGHGIKRGVNGYFMPTDGESDRPFASGLEYDYWRTEINDIDCKHILVAIDACHSIAFDPNWRNRSDRDFSQAGKRFTDQVLLNHQTYRARFFWTSDAVGNQTPDRSTFASELLKGLRTVPLTNPYWTASELFSRFLQKAIPSPGGGAFGDNEAGAAFLFFRSSDQEMNAMQADRKAWEVAQNKNEVAAYQQYVDQFPTGAFASEARIKLEQLQTSQQEQEDWEQAKLDNQAPIYRDFINKYPNSLFKEEASLRARDHMVLVQGGTFDMGSKFGKEEKPHMVRLNDYYISPYEVTFYEFDAFCVATNRRPAEDEGWDRKNYPVVNVTWYDAIEYCNWMSKNEGLIPVYDIDKKTLDKKNRSKRDTLKWTVSANWRANGYRLPTEAEWEYAARSRGKDQKWAGTSDETRISIFANFCDIQCKGLAIKKFQDDGYTYSSPVGSFQANGLNLFDMSGNVQEWCWDWYHKAYYSKSPLDNATGPLKGSYRVIRGGSWYSEPERLRCAYRYYLRHPNFGYPYLGFRLAKTAK